MINLVSWYGIIIIILALIGLVAVCTLPFTNKLALEPSDKDMDLVSFNRLSAALFRKFNESSTNKEKQSPADAIVLAEDALVAFYNLVVQKNYNNCSVEFYIDHYKNFIKVFDEYIVYHIKHSDLNEFEFYIRGILSTKIIGKENAISWLKLYKLSSTKFTIDGNKYLLE